MKAVQCNQSATRYLTDHPRDGVISALVSVGVKLSTQQWLCEPVQNLHVYHHFHAMLNSDANSSDESSHLFLLSDLREKALSFTLEYDFRYEFFINVLYNVEEVSFYF